jgi:hypothetical protein
LKSIAYDKFFELAKVLYFNEVQFNGVYSRREQIGLFEKPFRTQVTTIKPQRGDINIAWGNAPGNPSYAHVEYTTSLIKKRIKPKNCYQTKVWTPLPE